ncbi:MAG: putative metal-binding motif-containing protein, partial [Myxococcales bacterium]|nr:putative metal-binding motif-containing protein [Myxococcales bacterium]
MLTNRCFCAVAVVLGLGAFASSCSTEPGGSTQTSADGGDDAGIDAGPAPCTSDAECDDGRYCNGEETCDAGFCADGAKVVCDDGIECTVDVCSEAERACVSAAPDKDGDGKGDIHCVNADNEPLGDDCDDNDANRFPGNVEVCDQGTHDEDCNPETFGRVDNDGDTFYSAACCNVGPDDTMYCGTDCDDVRSNVNPNATEACDGFDNDCDSTMDEGVGIQLYPDLDGDGHGDENAVPVLACAGAARLSNVNDDCNDGDPAIHGTQLEICDGK